jgi:hypothetical protein
MGSSDGIKEAIEKLTATLDKMQATQSSTGGAPETATTTTISSIRESAWSSPVSTGKKTCSHG